MPGLRLQGFGPDLLAPCDLRIGPGETVTLTGPSGSGKSLFLRAIADLDPHRGQAWLDHRACADMAPPDWRRQVAYLPAESHWWSSIVHEHFAAREPALVERLGLAAAVYDWPVARLSSGERQRLAVARLLAAGPQVLLLDEPTANLDRENTRRVEQVVGDYQAAASAAVLWISHDPGQHQRLGRRRLVIRDRAIHEEAAWA